MSDPTALQSLAQELFNGGVIDESKTDSTAPPPSATPTMGKLNKIGYTHKALIDQIICNPQATQNQLAALFGYTPAWVSNIMASDAFQAALARRREEVIDPTVIATIEERIRGMTLQSLAVIQRKLDEPAVAATVALRAFELGAKGLGLGGHAPPAPVPIDLDKLAERLIALNPSRTVEGEVLAKEISV